MLFRGLLFALLLYLIYRFLTRWLGNTKSNRQNRHSNRFDPNAGATNGRRKKNLDQIEEAEFEDITEKEKK